jgi:hypothetical protein
MRDDNLAKTLDKWRGLTVQPLPADQLPPIAGHKVADTYGLLAHYTTWEALGWMLKFGNIGGDIGCWLTPTPYAACMVSYTLGLNTPRTVCLIVDVCEVSTLQGPGTSPPSGRYPTIWLGGGIEFFSPHPIPFKYVKRVIEIRPCGDTH